ncbi:uncharacterized protein GGS22DRAFT_190917 [Annulohypoxylon maeteangense]|uniref:uncharacterized protein n=1 Tax=Annulohypoxylon maeteangense TaxID=1927788 RepID=UPI0020086667|nr:uncharacterized protein GGS22DRAFT_190917 [Annulohypoxylon maeteangense]KAI0882940.1 hypothetical protein GGS22DRAFT_190917 [Annulohypoxylon maeteangense]
MLPQTLEEPYAQGKLDTTAFITWLADTVHTCNRTIETTTATFLPLPTTSGQTERFQFQSRRRQRRGSPYQYSLRELNERVNFILESHPTIRIPKRIKVRLQRAIDVRQKCLEWFEATENKPNEFDVVGHRHFIRFLIHAQTRFNELEFTNAAIRMSAHKTPSVDHGICFENRFSQLEIENGDDP